MEGSREGQGNHLSEELQDESGLELSLGLGLSSAESRQKWKAPEGPAARCPPAVDYTGEPSVAGSTFNGMNSYGKLKASSKTSGLDAALKKFLEGRLDEQDESSKLIDASNKFTAQKEKEKSPSLGAQDRSGKQLEAGMDIENRGKPFLFKELQVPSGGQGASRGPSPNHTSPLLVDALKIAPLGSNSGSPSSAEGLGRLDGGDDGTQEGSEQHRKFQEVQKKRKHIIEEHQRQKKGKEEDQPGTHGFCMPSSNTWVSASAPPDTDNSLLGLRGADSSQQAQQETSQESHGGLKRSADIDGNDESAGFDRNGLHDSKGTGDDAKGVEVNFMPPRRLQAENHEWNLTLQSPATEISMRGLPSLLNKQRDGQASGREGSPMQRLIEKVPSETSSASTDGTEKLEEKGRGVGEASSSAPPEVMGSSDKAISVSAAAATPFFPPGGVMATASTTPLPYPTTLPHSVAMMPYSVPGSMPSAPPGIPFPVGLNAPYLMQYLPPDGPERNSVRPGSISSFQPLAGIDIPPPHQLPSLEGAPWIQALRPPVGAPFTHASNGVLYSRNAAAMVEDADNRLKGARVHDNVSGNASMAAGDNPAFQNHSFLRTVGQISTQDSQLHQGPDGLPHPSLPIPAVPHFSSRLLPLSDHGELLRALKEQGNMNAFPGFAAHGLPGGGGSARPPSSSGVKEDGGGQDQAKFPGKVERGNNQRNMAERSSLGPEEIRRGQFQQGSTENLSVGDGLGQDMALLQRGVAPGLRFGGSGTPPDLPWVYTAGPNGRAIGGVLYKLSQTQLRVVCACHGKHMSPAEFTQHAGGSDMANAEKNAAANSSPLTSQAT